MRKSGRILVASLLITVFGVFTVGVPMVRFLCPMMNDDVSACPISPKNTGSQPAFATETPSCCASYIVAERNTTPYTSVEKYSSQPLQALGFATPDDVASFSSVSPVVVACCSTASPPLPGEPLYILKNSLLI